MIIPSLSPSPELFRRGVFIFPSRKGPEMKKLVVFGLALLAFLLASCGVNEAEIARYQAEGERARAEQASAQASAEQAKAAQAQAAAEAERERTAQAREASAQQQNPYAL